MVGRVKEAPRAQAARPVVRRTVYAAPRPRRQRALFSISLFVFAIASSWAGLVLFARVYPALFPGKVLTDALPGGDALASLPGPVRVAAPGPDSSFNRRINLLVIGVDKRPEEGDDRGGLTDSLMVATIDPVSKQASILSIPRDLWVDVHPPGGGTYKNRINESFELGWDPNHNPDEGAHQLEKDIKANFGIDIDYYILLDFKGVEKLIDSLGGVDIDIPYELAVPDWWYSDDDIHAEWVNFPPGPQHLDGYHAVAFGRYRNDSDLYRVKRQQLVLTTALARVFAQGILNTNPFSLWDAYASTVKTDIPRANMPGYVFLLKATNGTMQTYSLGDPVNGRETVYGFETAGGAQVLGWDPQNVQAILAQMFAKAKYAQSDVEIRGAYGNTDAGAESEQLGRYLRFTKGLPTVSIGPDVAIQAHTTIVLYEDARRDMATDIANWLGLPASAIQATPRPADRSVPDMVIYVGSDFHLPGGSPG